VHREDLFESVPNFSEGKRRDVIDAIAAGAGRAHLLDVDPDPDHNRVVVSIAGHRATVVDGLMAAVSAAVERIDVHRHHGVHPRVGAADVVPIVPLGRTTMDSSRETAREVAERIWDELGVPVYLYGENRTLADIRHGRARPDIGGPGHHPTAGAACVGARRILVAFNVLLPEMDVVTARGLARSLRESAKGRRGVQALIFELPGGRVQLSMNLFRVDETTPADVIAELEGRGIRLGPQQLVGLCPASVANEAASGRLLEARLAAAAARAGAARSAKRGGEEHLALAGRLRSEGDALAGLGVDQEDLLSGAERAAALPHVLRVGKILDEEVETMLEVASRGLRAAISSATAAAHAARIAALNHRIANGGPGGSSRREIR
jgi:glutamate formiminotransferase / 5-formyltetrahydrofolate cyclo-ligase